MPLEIIPFTNADNLPDNIDLLDGYDEQDQYGTIIFN